jgi:ketosteroid isomerase-like protein
MTAPEDPAVIVRAVCEGVSRLVSGDPDQAQREAQLDQLAALYAERTDVRHPFAPGGGPILHTRADLRRHFAQAPGRADGIQRFEPVVLHVHRTADPEVVITEYRYEGSAGARPVSIANILVTRVRDGMITESRDYADHIAAARAFGHFPALAATLAAEEQS